MLLVALLSLHSHLLVGISLEDFHGAYPTCFDGEFFFWQSFDAFETVLWPA